MTKTIIIILLIVFLIVITMFIFLKNAVNAINKLSKQYFLDKLQVYDEMIEKKEKKLQELINKINTISQIENDHGENTHDKIDIDYNLLIKEKSDYEVQNLFPQLKKIEKMFDLKYDEIINCFIRDNCPSIDETKDIYSKYVAINEVLTFDYMYLLSMMTLKEQINEFNRVFANYPFVINDFKNNNYDIILLKRFIESKIMEYDPHIYIYVGNERENYNYLNKNIITRFDESIYKGILISYRGKIADYGLNQDMK